MTAGDDDKQPVQIYIVTVKLPANPEHNPAEKKTGSCPFSPACTDLTGEHHSFLEASDGGVEQVREAVAARGFHVTRIEAAARHGRSEDKLNKNSAAAAKIELDAPKCHA